MFEIALFLLKKNAINEYNYLWNNASLFISTIETFRDRPMYNFQRQTHVHQQRGCQIIVRSLCGPTMCLGLLHP